MKRKPTPIRIRYPRILHPGSDEQIIQGRERYDTIEQTFSAIQNEKEKTPRNQTAMIIRAATEFLALGSLEEIVPLGRSALIDFKNGWYRGVNLDGYLAHKGIEFDSKAHFLRHFFGDLVDDHLHKAGQGNVASMRVAIDYYRPIVDSFVTKSPTITGNSEQAINSVLDKLKTRILKTEGYDISRQKLRPFFKQAYTNILKRK